MMTLRTLLLLALVLQPAMGWAQLGRGEQVTPNRQVLQMGLYPPDVIMRHQQRLGITDEQRGNILAAVKQFQSEVAELQWNLQSEQQQLRQALSGYEIDTDPALARARKVLDMEAGFKIAHFRLLIAIKNELTEEQIDMIGKELRKRREADRR